MGRLLKMSEVCARLDVDIETTRKWRKNSAGPPSFLVGGSVRYDEDDLNIWLAAQRSASLAGGNGSVISYACHVCGFPIARGTGILYCSFAEINEAHARAVEQVKEPRDASTLKDALDDQAATARWRTRHLECEDGVDERVRFGYEIGVEEVDTPEGLFDWTGHLWEKTWFSSTDWGDFLLEQVKPGLEQARASAVK